MYIIFSIACVRQTPVAATVCRTPQAAAFLAHNSCVCAILAETPTGMEQQGRDDTMRQEKRVGSSARRSLGVVVTGGTAGLGRALARGFLLAGDRVAICGRDAARLESALRVLRAEIPGCELYGVAADISDPAQAAAFAVFAKTRLGAIDRWLNNAGTAGAFRKPLWELDASDMEGTCRTNLCGTMMLCAEALRAMLPRNASTEDAHLFNMGFSLAGMSASPTNLPHRISKRAVALTTSLLRKELKASGIDGIGVHEVSPGLVLTGLLLRDAGAGERRQFNVLADTPERVAAVLVPKLREARGRGGNIRYRSVAWMLIRLLASTFGFGRDRFFDRDGRRIPGN